MDLNKHLEFFNPLKIKAPIHIIGVGAIGSTVAEMLARLGFRKLHIYDFDTVSSHNITNQMFRFKDLGAPKVDALEDILKEINPDIEINKHPRGWLPHMKLTGYIVLAVDSIEIRKEVVKMHQYSDKVLAMYDYRMRLTDASHHAADWHNTAQVETLWEGMQFTAEEAKEATPVNACGTSLSVTPTVRNIVSLGVANMMNTMQGHDTKSLILADPFACNLVDM